MVRLIEDTDLFINNEFLCISDSVTDNSKLSWVGLLCTIKDVDTPLEYSPSGAIEDFEHNYDLPSMWIFTCGDSPGWYASLDLEQAQGGYCKMVPLSQFSKEDVFLGKMSGSWDHLMCKVEHLL